MGIKVNGGVSKDFGKGEEHSKEWALLGSTLLSPHIPHGMGIGMCDSWIEDLEETYGIYIY